MSGRIVISGFIGAALVLSAHVANAQIAGGAATLPPSVVSAFQANPGQLLTQYPNAGPEFIKQLRDLLSSNKATLQTIIALAKNATEEQRKAMAGVLADVAKAYAAAGDPAFANQIQVAVANSGIPEFAKAYAEAAGDTGTAATGGGGGGGGPSTNGAPSGGANPGNTNNGNTFVANGATNLLTGGTLGSIGGTSTTTTTTITQTSTF
jgi:hypothetical protein